MKFFSSVFTVIKYIPELNDVFKLLTKPEEGINKPKLHAMFRETSPLVDMNDFFDVFSEFIKFLSQDGKNAFDSSVKIIDSQKLVSERQLPIVLNARFLGPGTQKTYPPTKMYFLMRNLYAHALTLRDKSAETNRISQLQFAAINELITLLESIILKDKD